MPRIVLLLAAILIAPVSQAFAQGAPGGPPSVGVVSVVKKPVTETSNFVGRIQAVNRVDIVARVTGFLEERAFVEGAEVTQGDLLYRLERGPFEADVQAKQAAVAQNQALLRNANITLGRAQSLLHTPAGLVSQVDDSEAQRASVAAQLLGAQAQLQQSQINLAYTEIHAPLTGKITRSSVSVGNVVGPTSPPLATIVSQDPMYVLFPVSLRASLDLRDRYAGKGGFDAVVVRVRLPNGKQYDQVGQLEYVDPSVQINTDTVNLRATIPNPAGPGLKPGEPGNRELVDGAFVTVVVEGIQPVPALAIPRAAVLSDQQGNFVYVVDADKKAQIRRIQLGQSTPEVAVVLAGLSEGESVISEGIQRVRPGAPVNPAPASPGPIIHS